MDVNWGSNSSDSQGQENSFPDCFSIMSTKECSDLLEKQQIPGSGSNAKRPSNKEWEVDNEYLRKLEARLEKLQKPKKIGQDMIKQLHDRTEMLFSTNYSTTTANHLAEISIDGDKMSKGADSQTLIKNDGLEQKHREEQESMNSSDNVPSTKPTQISDTHKL